MAMTPGNQTVCVGDLVEIDLVVVSDGVAQLFDSLDTLLMWDPALLDLLGVDDTNADVDWFLAGFLPVPL